METPLFISRLKTGFVSLSRKKTWGFLPSSHSFAQATQKGVRYVLYCTQSERLHCQRAMASFSGPIEGLLKRWPSL